MTHKAKKVGSDMREMMDNRQERIYEINDLKFKVSKIEDAIKRRLIDERQTDLLKVDWNRLSRVL